MGCSEGPMLLSPFAKMPPQEGHLQGTVLMLPLMMEKRWQKEVASPGRVSVHPARGVC